ncbi:hypothetical protein XENOCAPTIV_020344 [Xenoophorus captivus]|uniref:Uncharacterized protein n=1 Tax=Xenoophorus captivus TaxID=1517983 RepID=A0ABV0RZW1_9TELE
MCPSSFTKSPELSQIGRRFSARVVLYLAPSILPSTLTSPQHDATTTMFHNGDGMLFSFQFAVNGQNVQRGLIILHRTATMFSFGISYIYKGRFEMHRCVLSHKKQ